MHFLHSCVCIISFLIVWFVQGNLDRIPTAIVMMEKSTSMKIANIGFVRLNLSQILELRPRTYMGLNLAILVRCSNPPVGLCIKISRRLFRFPGANLGLQMRTLVYLLFTLVNWAKCYPYSSLHFGEAEPDFSGYGGAEPRGWWGDEEGLSEQLLHRSRDL